MMDVAWVLYRVQREVPLPEVPIRILDRHLQANKDGPLQAFLDDEQTKFDACQFDLIATGTVSKAQVAEVKKLLKQISQEGPKRSAAMDPAWVLFRVEREVPLPEGATRILRKHLEANKDGPLQAFLDDEKQKFDDCQFDLIATGNVSKAQVAEVKNVLKQIRNEEQIESTLANVRERAPGIRQNEVSVEDVEKYRRFMANKENHGVIHFAKQHFDINRQQWAGISVADWEKIQASFPEHDSLCNGVKATYLAGRGSVKMTSDDDLSSKDLQLKKTFVVYQRLGDGTYDVLLVHAAQRGELDEKKYNQDWWTYVGAGGIVGGAVVGAGVVMAAGTGPLGLAVAGAAGSAAGSAAGGGYIYSIKKREMFAATVENVLAGYITNELQIQGRIALKTDADGTRLTITKPSED